MMGEREKLLKMEETLQSHVIGQPEACHAVASALKISRAGLHAHDRPLGTFLFLGPTGMLYAQFRSDPSQVWVRLSFAKSLQNLCSIPRTLSLEST